MYTYEDLLQYQHTILQGIMDEHACLIKKRLIDLRCGNELCCTEEYKLDLLIAYYQALSENGIACLECDELSYIFKKLDIFTNEIPMCILTGNVDGCSDPDALNYHPLA